MGNPRYQIAVLEPVFELAHARARQNGWPSTSAWLRHLLRTWDGSPLEPRPRRTKQLSVRLDREHEAQLEHIAQVSDTSLSEAFAMLVESALMDDSALEESPPTDAEQPQSQRSEKPRKPPARKPPPDPKPPARRQPARQPPNQSKPAIPKPDDYEGWAEIIMRAARKTPHKFGNNRAFISGVLDELVSQFQPDDPEAFRARVREILPELNRLDLVPLVRADLVGSMPPELVKKSALPHLNATFHFVALPQS